MSRATFRSHYGFEQSREYELEFEGRFYDSKPIAAVAFGYQFGIDPLTHDECNGGVARGSAAWALNRLGFSVTGVRHVGWWLYEVEGAVEAYFEMQALADTGTEFQKADYIRRLQIENPRRTGKAFEFKLQNVSGVLRELGRPWLSGYAPARHYQELVRFVVQDRIGVHSKNSKSTHDTDTRKDVAKRAKVDWAQRDAANRRLGRAGELFVLDTQRRKLIKANRLDLAAKTRWVSEEADGDGYDIETFEANGEAVFVEVKTTSGPVDTPFFLSANELAVWEAKGAQYQLHRVFDFLKIAKIEVYTGEAGALFDLAPCSYRITQKR
jgi:hypothetical protein